MTHLHIDLLQQQQQQHKKSCTLLYFYFFRTYETAYERVRIKKYFRLRHHCQFKVAQNTVGANKKTKCSTPAETDAQHETQQMLVHI